METYTICDIPEQLPQNPARAFLQEEWREDESERTLLETGQKLLKKRARPDQKNFFPVKIVGKWNDLPAQARVSKALLLQ